LTDLAAEGTSALVGVPSQNPFSYAPSFVLASGTLVDHLLTWPAAHELLNTVSPTCAGAVALQLLWRILREKWVQMGPISYTMFVRREPSGKIIYRWRLANTA
jgi:hypothetical protein